MCSYLYISLCAFGYDEKSGTLRMIYSLHVLEPTGYYVKDLLNMMCTPRTHRIPYDPTPSKTSSHTLLRLRIFEQVHSLPVYITEAPLLLYRCLTKRDTFIKDFQGTLILNMFETKSLCIPSSNTRKQLH